MLERYECEKVLFKKTSKIILETINQAIFTVLRRLADRLKSVVFLLRPILSPNVCRREELGLHGRLRSPF